MPTHDQGRGSGRRLTGELDPEIRPHRRRRDAVLHRQVKQGLDRPQPRRLAHKRYAVAPLDTVADRWGGLQQPKGGQAVHYGDELAVSYQAAGERLRFPKLIDRPALASPGPQNATNDRGDGPPQLGLAGRAA